MSITKGISKLCLVSVAFTFLMVAVDIDCKAQSCKRYNKRLKSDKVTCLSVDDRNMALFIEHLDEWKDLKELHIHSDTLSWVPHELCVLEDLEVVYVSDLRLQRINALACLAKLKELTIASERLEEIPDEIYALYELKKLRVVGYLSEYERSKAVLLKYVHLDLEFIYLK